MLIDFFIFSAIAFLVVFLWIAYTRFFGAEWKKMPADARNKMLEMLKLSKKDIFCDAGCGDGQLLIEAAPKVKKAIGIEIDPARFAIAKARTGKMKNVEVVRGNALNMKIKADKLAVFLSKEACGKIGAKIPKNAAVASYKWPIAGIKIVGHDMKNRIFLQNPRRN